MATIIWDAVASLFQFKQAMEEARRFYELTPDQEAVVAAELVNIEAAWGRIHGAFYAPGAVLVKREQPPDPPLPPMTVPEIVQARRTLVNAGVRPALAADIYPLPRPEVQNTTQGEDSNVAEGTPDPDR